MSFKDLSQKQRYLFIFFVGAIFIFAILAIFFVTKPKQVVLYQDNDLANVSAVIEQLTEQGVNYELAEQGHSILVADSVFNKLNVHLAQIDKLSNTSPGFELFDNVDYSMTEHAQKVTYQRAIQGELEKTLRSYHEIANARVHITTPDKRLFNNAQSKVKASVSLWFVDNLMISEQQIKGIQRLVSSSVDDLMAEEVVVLGANGQQLSRSPSSSSQHILPDGNYENKLETLMTQKAKRLLNLYFLPSETAVSVTVSVDKTQKKQTTKAILLNDNQEGFVTKRKESVSSMPTNETVGETEKDKKLEVEYEHGIETAEQLSMPGTIKQVSVAVAISSNIESAVIKKLESLVFAGLGLRDTRGDLLSVEVLSITPNTLVNAIAEPIQDTGSVLPVLEVNNIQPRSNFNIWFIAVAVLVVLVSLFVFLSFSRYPKLNTKQLEAKSIEFQSWLNDKELMKNANR